MISVVVETLVPVDSDIKNRQWHRRRRHFQRHQRGASAAQPTLCHVRSL